MLKMATKIEIRRTWPVACEGGSPGEYVTVNSVLAGGQVQTNSIVRYSWADVWRGEHLFRTYTISRDTLYYYTDSFSGPLAFREGLNQSFGIEFGVPYVYSHMWEYQYAWKGEYLLE